MIFGSLRHDHEDYEEEYGFHWDRDKKAVLRTRTLPQRQSPPSPFFAVPRFSARSQDSVQDLLSGDTRGVRSTDRLQILSWKLEPLRGDDSSVVANHICWLWHLICVQDSANSANHPILQHWFHVATAHHCAILLNSVTTKPFLVPAWEYADWALERLVVKRWLRRPADGGRDDFTILNMHANNKCDRRRSVCSNQLFWLRCFRRQVDGGRDHLWCRMCTSITNVQADAPCASISSCCYGAWASKKTFSCSPATSTKEFSVFGTLCFLALTPRPLWCSALATDSTKVKLVLLGLWEHLHQCLVGRWVSISSCYLRNVGDMVVAREDIDEVISRPGSQRPWYRAAGSRTNKRHHHP